MKLKRHSERGYSLLEILITLAILSVLATLALATFSRPKAQFEKQNFARQLKINLERARFDSIKRRAAADEMSKVTLINQYSYELASDLNADGILESNEISTIELPRNGGVKITGSFNAFPVTVKFNFRGQVAATDGNNSTINPFFIVCDADCSPANADSSNASTIAVSPAGTISFLSGGKTMPEAPQPNVSNVGSGQKIDQGGMVSN